MENGTNENPYSHAVDGENWGGKFCECVSCGVVAIATPSFDFYTFPNGDITLHCEKCFLAICHARGMTVRRIEGL